MKRLITLLSIFMIVLLSSCDNSYIEGGKSQINPLKETTVEVLQKIDTTKVYYAYVGEHSITLVNKDTRLVEYRIFDNSSLSMFLLALVCILFFSIFVVINILTE
jgi:hypothetical protein